jgi:hypothetical protein
MRLPSKPCATTTPTDGPFTYKRFTGLPRVDMSVEWFATWDSNIEMMITEHPDWAIREWKKNRDALVATSKWAQKLEREVARLGGDVESLR